jgi:hypothetical protein
MDIENKFRLREAEIWFSKQMKIASKPSQSIPRYLKNVQRSFEVVNNSSLFSSRCFHGSRLRKFDLIEKAYKTPDPGRKRTRPLSSVPFLHKSKSFKRKKSEKKCLIQQKSLQFQPSKGKVPIIIKNRLRDYQFSFDLENGVMRSVSVLCKL